MFLKWIFDKVVSVIGLAMLSPVLLIVTILIKRKMPGPILFCQKRVGQYGKLFTVYKFRSMTVKTQASVASKGSETTYIASTEQSRITPLGEKLRRYKLDELPELWNVLKGEERDILKLKPGITGPASLKYRNEEELLSSVDNPIQYNDEVIFPDKVRLNLYYLKHYSFIKDIQMIVCTVLSRKMNYAGENI